MKHLGSQELVYISAEWEFKKNSLPYSNPAAFLSLLAMVLPKPVSSGS